MSAPGTVDEFLDLVQRSGLVDKDRLTAYLADLRATGPLTAEPPRLAGALVRDGILTCFQAEQILLGKWRRLTIGRYKVLERLGFGRTCSVYLCEHEPTHRRVAVKVLPTAKADDPSSLERFYREARAVAALNHPNIVRAYDIDQDDKLHFLVMEYVDGSSLQEIIKKVGPMAVIRAAHYMRQAALGLQHIHESAGLVHRDIKPADILVDRRGLVKIIDLGSCRFFHDGTDIPSRTYDHHVIGTPDYVAPEQALDPSSVDIRADIYSLGATFYLCLVGWPPFPEGTDAQKLIWHQVRQPEPIRRLQSESPRRRELASLIERMMAENPAQRPQSPQEVADALAPFTEQPIGPPPEEEMPRLSPAASSKQSRLM
jgi:serine/threonine protein kinase